MDTPEHPKPRFRFHGRRWQRHGPRPKLRGSACCTAPSGGECIHANVATDHRVERSSNHVVPRQVRAAAFRATRLGCVEVTHQRRPEGHRLQQPVGKGPTGNRTGCKITTGPDQMVRARCTAFQKYWVAEAQAEKLGPGISRLSPSRCLRAPSQRCSAEPARRSTAPWRRCHDPVSASEASSSIGTSRSAGPCP